MFIHDSSFCVLVVAIGRGVRMENIPALANQAERSAVGGNSKKLGGPKTEKEGKEACIYGFGMS